MLGGIHIIDEGHVGIYTRGGALLGGITEPGLHTMIPLITKVHQVQITLQTDKVQNIPVHFFLHLFRNYSVERAEES